VVRSPAPAGISYNGALRPPVIYCAKGQGSDRRPLGAHDGNREELADEAFDTV
jgi:hypothetical protein